MLIIYFKPLIMTSKIIIETGGKDDLHFELMGDPAKLAVAIGVAMDKHPVIAHTFRMAVQAFDKVKAEQAEKRNSASKN